MDTDALIGQLPGASDALKALARRGVVKTYARGRVLFHEGDMGDALFVILAGRVRVYWLDASGSEFVIERCEPGQFVGDMDLDVRCRWASAESIERGVCAVVTRPMLEAHIAECPAFAFELLNRVIRRARAAARLTRQPWPRGGLDVYGRLRLLLEQLARPGPDGTRRTVEGLTHQDIAHRIGCTCMLVSLILQGLERAGFVRSDGEHIDLLRPLPIRW